MSRDYLPTSLRLDVAAEVEYLLVLIQGVECAHAITALGSVLCVSVSLSCGKL